ncbi:type IV-A pilus assembly ATPase PilB [Aeromonas veronii]|uniref:type IV-A pilus assembly ATPase PilB n=1 Tax=Aeromonas veronii TaxID=654 RepID=UPI003D21E753
MNYNFNSGLASSLAALSLISKENTNHYLAQAKSHGKSFTAFLVENQILGSKFLANFCEEKYGLSLTDLDSFTLADIPQKFLNQKLIDKHHALPLFTKENTLYIAMSDPTNFSALEDFGFNFGLHTEVILVEENKLAAAINRLLEFGSYAIGIEEIDESQVSILDIYNENVRQDISVTVTSKTDDAPIVKYINKMLINAINRGASDLHFEPYEFEYRIRFRIDGILHKIATPPINLANRISARLKVMARLDIAERRLPQDGRIKLKLSNKKSIDMRVNVLPTLWGEKIVIRLLDSSATRLDIEQLGFDDRQKMQYLSALSKPQGMLLITGPTGSGKTVSLYTGLNILNTTAVNILTAEDPVEINLLGVNQVQVDPKIGLNFANALRSFLRQDPDVVMVGEIRDLETAEIAIKAAQTGHLVLSTLHTNSAAETLTRMMNMGVPTFNIATSVTLVIAQRLIRKLCVHCKEPDVVSDEELVKLGFLPQQLAAGRRLFRAVGCKNCSGGYKGRVGVYEVMPISKYISKLILLGANSQQITKAAQKEGMRTIRISALEKARFGITSLAEANRITTY